MNAKAGVLFCKWLKMKLKAFSDTLEPKYRDRNSNRRFHILVKETISSRLCKNMHSWHGKWMDTMIPVVGRMLHKKNYVLKSCTSWKIVSHRIRKGFMWSHLQWHASANVDIANNFEKISEYFFRRTIYGTNSWFEAQPAATKLERRCGVLGNFGTAYAEDSQLPHALSLTYQTWLYIYSHYSRVSYRDDKYTNSHQQYLLLTTICSCEHTQPFFMRIIRHVSGRTGRPETIIHLQNPAKSMRYDTY